MSQMLSFLSLPPVAILFPLGAMATWLMLPSWALNEYLIWKLRLQIFNLPSHPVDTKYGSRVWALVVLLTWGENRTLLTQSTWLYLSEVLLRSPKMFQYLIFLSASPEMMILLSGERATEKISLSCPTNCFLETPFFKSQSLRVLSHEELIKWLLSLERARSEMKWLWPVRDF